MHSCECSLCIRPVMAHYVLETLSYGITLAYQSHPRPIPRLIHASLTCDYFRISPGASPRTPGFPLPPCTTRANSAHAETRQFDQRMRLLSCAPAPKRE